MTKTLYRIFNFAQVVRHYFFRLEESNAWETASFATICLAQCGMFANKCVRLVYIYIYIYSFLCAFSACGFFSRGRSSFLPFYICLYLVWLRQHRQMRHITSFMFPLSSSQRQNHSSYLILFPFSIPCFWAGLWCIANAFNGATRSTKLYTAGVTRTDSR